MNNASIWHIEIHDPAQLKTLDVQDILNRICADDTVSAMAALNNGPSESVSEFLNVSWRVTRPKGPFWRPYILTVTWNEAARLARDNPERRYSSVDPPWGTSYRTFSRRMLSKAVKYSFTHARGIGVPDGAAARDTRRCAACGRDFGWLGTYRAVPADRLRIDANGHFEIWDDGDPLLAMHPECAHEWKKTYFELLRDPDAGEKAVPGLCKLVQGGWDDVIGRRYLDHMRGVLSGR